jgi:parallel beta-helix repeat protein
MESMKDLALPKYVKHYSPVITFLLLATACQSDQNATPLDPTAAADPSAVEASMQAAGTSSLSLSPDTVTLAPGQAHKFSATAPSGSGKKSPAPDIAYTATGGTISDSGSYVAGATPGTFAVVAKTADGTLADTATVMIASTTPSTTIYPGSDIQASVNAFPGGTRFTLKAGVHRLQRITPKSGDVFVGEPGAILSGARKLTSFTRSGSYWVAGGQTQQGKAAGRCDAGFAACIYPEDLFINDVVLQRVTSLASVGVGKWYFDYATDKVYFADDPTGKTVEIGATDRAFNAAGTSNVTVQNLIIEKYASPAQAAALQGDGSSGWIVQDNEFRWNHGMGLRVGNGMRALRNKVHHNGQLGMGGKTVNGLVEGNEIAYNNTLRFDRNWEAGGTKFAFTSGLVVRNNYVHHNHGMGLWTDIDNINTLYEGNRAEDNDNCGIFHEVSYAAIIRNNTARRNGFGAGVGWMDGAGILVSSSPNVEVYGNTISGNRNGITAIQTNRGSGAYGPHLTSNLYVHDNTITMARGVTGVAQNVWTDLVFTSQNNRFRHNTYYLSTASPFAWLNANRTEAQWKAYGQDRDGIFNR